MPFTKEKNALVPLLLQKRSVQACLFISLGHFLWCYFCLLLRCYVECRGKLNFANKTNKCCPVFKCGHQQVSVRNIPRTF